MQGGSLIGAETRGLAFVFGARRRPRWRRRWRRRRKPPMPGAPDEPAAGPPCCGVPPRDEVTADHVFGRWVVLGAAVGAPLRAGDRVEFRTDGTLATNRGACRYAVLRAELTVTCADSSASGELRFVDDTKLIWRHDGRKRC